MIKGEVQTVNIKSNPIPIQKLPQSTCTTVTSVSLAGYPNNPAINCPTPPEIATNGKKIPGDLSPPHHLATYVAVMKVEHEKPARPIAAGAAIGLRKVLTFGS